MSLMGSTSFGFVQNTMHDFQNTVLNSLTNATKIVRKGENTGDQHFLFLDTMFSTHTNTFRLHIKFILPSANTFNLNKVW